MHVMYEQENQVREGDMGRVVHKPSRWSGEFCKRRAPSKIVQKRFRFSGRRMEFQGMVEGWHLINQSQNCQKKNLSKLRGGGKWEGRFKGRERERETCG